MSVALFDLGQRLRAATLRQPVARSTFAPVLPSSGPVAVTVTGAGDGVVVRAADGNRMTLAGGQDPLAALAELGVSIGAEPRTLVIADREALSRLEELARATDPAAPCGQTAAMVGWWAQRADHPGTGAVLNVTGACCARWVLGVPPAAERHLSVWRQRLGVRADGPTALLQLAAAVSAGRTLPGLQACAEEDDRSWEAFTTRDWPTPVSPGTGAGRIAGVRRRSAWPRAPTRPSYTKASAWAIRSWRCASHSAAGWWPASSRPCRRVRVLEITLDHLACRLRESGLVEGFAGYPRDLPPAGEPGAWLRGRVVGTRVTGDERLVVTIGDAVVRPGPARIGQRLTLRPQSVDPRRRAPANCSRRQCRPRRCRATRRLPPRCSPPGQVIQPW